MQDDIYILDGYGLIYRAYFALISRPLTDRSGKNISAVHGFFRILFSLWRNHGARRIAVAMDPAEPTFRHRRYPEYKAKRDSAPEDLHAQVPVIEDILNILGVPVICIDGYEADDVMGSVARCCREEGIGCLLVSADKDLMQLIDKTTAMLRPEKGGGLRRMGPQEVFEEKGVRPDQIIDYLALVGDSSDNIPGVKGIGEKTAAGLLAEWGDMDSIYANIEKAAKGARLSNMREGRKSAYFSRELVTVYSELDVAEYVKNLESMAVRADAAAAAAAFRERDMRSLAEDTESILGAASSLLATGTTGTAGTAGTGTAGTGTAGNRIGSTGARGGARTDDKDDNDKADSAPAPPETHYTAVLSEEDLAQWEQKIRDAGIAALDTETDGIDPMRASLVGISFCVKPGEAAYLPIQRPDGDCLEGAEVMRRLGALFADGSVKIVGQNFKYDMKILRRWGLEIPPAWFDTMIAAWVLDASSPVGMDALAGRYLGRTTLKFRDVVPKHCTFADVNLDQAVEYAAEDADITLGLFHTFAPLLEADPERKRIFDEYEMPLQPILTEMEMEGIGLDIDELQTYGKELGEGIDALAGEIHGLCGREFNIASPKQLQEVLFVDRGLTPGKKTKTGYSTDNSVLTDLAREDPVPEKILLYRSLTKLKSTYVDVLPELAHPEDGRIHTSYSQTGAATGRLSSNNPNLQNIPVRDENGRRIRRAFKSRPEYLFISADYSQIELVVLAHMSGDEALGAAFRDGVDVHGQTAAMLFGVDIADITSHQRRMAKAVNFGVMYGMSAFRLSNELSIPRKEAKHFIDAYFTTYRGIKNFIEEAVQQAEADGGVRTMEGRFRPLAGISSRNRAEKAAAERAAVNSKIQGTAADIMKAAMIAVHHKLKEDLPEARMLLQVHDEMLIEAPRSRAEAAASLLKTTMEAVSPLSLPLRVNVEIGGSWGEIH